MRYATVLFDLDGTLLDTLEDLCDACNYALHAVDAPARTLAEVRAFVGNGLGALMERALPGGRGNPRFSAALAILKDYYSSHSLVKTRPYPGVVDMLRALQAAGVKAAIVSNKIDAAVQALASACFPGLVSVAVGERPDVRRKPAPDLVLAALRGLSAPAATALYVGDSDVDLATARAAGLPCLSVTWGFRTRAQLLAAGATAFAGTPSDVLAFLRG